MSYNFIADFLFITIVYFLKALKSIKHKNIDFYWKKNEEFDLKKHYDYIYIWVIICLYSI